MGSIDCDFSLSVGDLSIDDEMMMGDDDATDDAIDDDALVGAIVDEMLMEDDDATDDAIDDDALVGAIVDEMLMGDDDATDDASSCETIEELLCSGPLSAKFTVLCSLLKSTPIPALTLTVFAPMDKAFGNLLELLGVASAAEVDSETLTAILMFHVAP